jgi:hypothetical protein
MTKFILRQFYYYDSDIVDSFLASLEGGIYDEEKQKTKSAKNGGAEVGGNVVAAKISVGGKLSSNKEVVRVVKQVAASQFARFYDQASKLDAITKVTSMNDKAWGKLDNGELIEVPVTLELAGVTQLVGLVSKIQQLAPQMKAMGSEFENPEALSGLSALMEGNNSVSVVAHIAAAPEYKFVVKLNPESLLRDKDDLKGEFTILGKIQRKLGSDEKVATAELFSGLQDFMPAEQLEGLEQQINGVNLGAMTVSAPAAILTPVAIYL